MRVFFIFIATLGTHPFIAAQQPQAAQEFNPPVDAAGPAKASAPIDLTGYWVSFVTKDWRFRMVTPHKGDYQMVPMNDQARKVADAWDPVADQAAGNQAETRPSPEPTHFMNSPKKPSANEEGLKAQPTGNPGGQSGSGKSP